MPARGCRRSRDRLTVTSASGLNVRDLTPRAKGRSGGRRVMRVTSAPRASARTGRGRTDADQATARSAESATRVPPSQGSAPKAPPQSAAHRSVVVSPASATPTAPTTASTAPARTVSGPLPAPPAASPQPHCQSPSSSHPAPSPASPAQTVSRPPSAAGFSQTPPVPARARARPRQVRPPPAGSAACRSAQ